jgi:deoxycytidylate deaminase
MGDSVKRIKYPELFFGFVAPIGADIASTIEAFRSYYRGRGYTVIEIKVTTVFDVLEKYIKPAMPLDRARTHKRYLSYIAYGNQLREQFGDEILAAISVGRIIRRRLRVARSDEEKYSKTIYLIHQFKRKEEIDLLRSVYGRLFFQVSIYSRRGARVDYLSRKFASDDNKSGHEGYRQNAEALVEADVHEVGQKHGQRVRKIFHDADFIISLDVRRSVREQVDRFCELIFGSNSISPNHQEYGLFLAKAAALRTLDLSRQVGAAIFAASGEVLTLGSNEVPKAGGGSYWSDGEFDDCDYVRKVDSNYARKKELLGELAKIICPDRPVEALMTDQRIGESQFMDALEYGRILHAEMSALTDAARIGHSVRGAILYCTTFPCHMCAKHIIASGIAKVIFLEPYPKSLASDLHSDSICVEGGDRGHYAEYPAVEFEHFFGVSPRRYREIFERGARKNEKTGRFVDYLAEVENAEDSNASPIVDIKYPFYERLEEFYTIEAISAIKHLAEEDEFLDV